MAHINPDTVRHLAQLSKIACSQEEEKKFLCELEQIFQYVEQLNEVNTEGVEPLFYVIEGENATPRRPDVVVQTITTKEFLDNAPQQVAQMVKVPKFRKEA